MWVLMRIMIFDVDGVVIVGVDVDGVDVEVDVHDDVNNDQ